MVLSSTSTSSSSSSSGGGGSGTSGAAASLAWASRPAAGVPTPSSTHQPSETCTLRFHLDSSYCTNTSRRRRAAAAAAAGQAQQPSRSKWPAFASLSANSTQMGQLRWKQAAQRPSPDNSSSNRQQPGPQQQQAEGEAEVMQQQQIEQDVQQLAQDVFQKGQVLAGGRYKLVDRIPITLGLADGRFTTIWQATDTATGKAVVLKCLEAGDTSSYAAGMREAALHAAAGRCPNIVALTDAFEHRSSSGRHPVMVLEPCGTNMLHVIGLYSSPQAADANARDGSIISGICDNPAALKRLAKDTLTALDHLHKNGVAHMDLSPDNVLLDKEFVSQEELHARALLPQGNFFKALQTKWRLFQAMLKSGSQPEQAAQLQDKLLSEMQASVEKNARGRYHEGTLHTGTFKLTDFGRAVPYREVLAGLLAGAEAAAAAGGGDAAGAAAQKQQQQQRYNRDGVVVFSDPAYQAPEEILGLSYAGPSYDMWRLGCLLFEAATDSKLFDCRLRGPLEEAYGEAGFSDQHFLLDSMTTALGSMPQELSRLSPLHEDFFCGEAGAQLSKQQAAKQKKEKKKGGKGQEASMELLLIHAGPLKATPGAKPLQALLLERTVLSEQEAKQMADFLAEVLRWDPDSRASAEQMLQHAWLQSVEPLQLS